MIDVRDGDYLDVLDVPPPCPVCGSALYEHVAEFRAHICDNCGHWEDDPA